MDITYRQAKPSDAAALLEYLKTVGGESDNLTFGSEGLPFTPEQEARFLERMAADPHCAVFLALEEDTIVGNGSLEGSSHPRLGHRCSIALTVRKSHWGHGIGTGLLQRLIAFAQNAGAEVISLEVRSDNHRAISLYQTSGFEKFGTYRNFFKIGETYFDADYMNLYL